MCVISGLEALCDFWILGCEIGRFTNVSHGILKLNGMARKIFCFLRSVLMMFTLLPGIVFPPATADRSRSVHQAVGRVGALRPGLAMHQWPDIICSSTREASSGHYGICGGCKMPRCRLGVGCFHFNTAL